MSEHSPSKISRNVLSDRETFALAKLVEIEWPNRQELGDIGFAVFATEKLGFNVSKGNVVGARKILGIELPGHRSARSTIAEIADLQRRLERLEQRFEVYLKGCLKDPSR